jgi:hypothetical protein
MIEQFLKVLLSEKSRVTLQFGILISVIVAAFYAGTYASKFTAAQEKSLEEQKKTTAIIQELVDQSKNYWTYQMHRAYDEGLTLNPDGTLRKPNLSEIREKFSN